MRNVPEQARVTREKAGLIHPFPRALLAVRGKDRTRFLNSLLTHDIKGLPDGQGRPACLLDRQGKILFSCVVHARPDELLLEMDPESLPAAREKLSRYLLSEDVQLEEVTERFRIAGVAGPDAAALLASAGPSWPRPDQPLQYKPGIPGSGLAGVVRWDFLAVPGYFLWMEAGKAQQLLTALEIVCQARGAAVVSPEALEILRIEAGIPRPGREIREEVILNELGSEEWMSFTKGCYVGQEIVVRIRHRAHPPRLLTGFFLEGETAAGAGGPILREGEPVGTLTSACVSPTLNRGIALGFLKYGVEDSEFTLQTPEGIHRVTRTSLPFVQHL